MKEQKINIVNPLKPNEILRTETIIAKENINTNQNINEIKNEQINDVKEIIEPIPEQTVEKENKGSKKTISIIIVFAFIAIIIGLVVTYFVVTNLNKPTPPINNNQNENNIQETIKPITLENIKTIFNENAMLYKFDEYDTINAQILDSRILVSIKYSQSSSNYEFIMTDRTLSTTLSNNDTTGYNVAIYIISSIAQHHKIDFNQSVTYLNNNINNLDNINNIEINDLEQTKIININLDKKLEIK